jgi:hypothetical protein
VKSWYLKNIADGKVRKGGITKGCSVSGYREKA